MPIYALTYDLNKQKDYQTLWDELERLDGCKAARSFYLLNLTDTDTQAVLNHFRGYVDDDDTLIVVKTSIKEIKTRRPIQGTSDWIKRNGG